jgi:DNA modification methylase
MQGYTIINEIIWVQRNGRPNVATRRLQVSHHDIRNCSPPDVGPTRGGQNRA